jgi:hypothetical protein
MRLAVELHRDQQPELSNDHVAVYVRAADRAGVE